MKQLRNIYEHLEDVSYSVEAYKEIKEFLKGYGQNILDQKYFNVGKEEFGTFYTWFKNEEKKVEKEERLVDLYSKDENLFWNEVDSLLSKIEEKLDKEEKNSTRVKREIEIGEDLSKFFTRLWEL